MKTIALNRPDSVRIVTEEQDVVCTGGGMSAAGVEVELREQGTDAAEVVVAVSGVSLCHVILHWNRGLDGKSLVLGDAWERAYGDLEFLLEQAGRCMPWYFLSVSESGQVYALGVKVRPAAFCCWQADREGITLWMDFRNGGLGTSLKPGELHAATLVQALYEEKSAFEAACEFCGRMCADPILPEAPVYGSNNWYYAYGNSSQEEFLQNAADLAELTEGNENRPYMVLDDCWQPGREQENGGPYGPWDRGNSRFPDMAGLAAAVEQKGVLPGIWVRLLLDHAADIPEAWRSKRDNLSLDPTVPEAAEKIAADVRRLADWGYRLIKHDFSTYDLFGRFGFQMNPLVTEGNWHFHDRTRTNAQIVTDFYRLVKENAGQALILGCTCIGHLGAGLMHLNRTGDDVSGLEWDRTRRMGVNTLAFRLPQHRKFYEVDADCIGITDKIPWELNRQWLHLLAHSGTPLFYSMAPHALGKEAAEELRKALRIASLGGEQEVEPIDWMETRTPRRWRCGRKTAIYNWQETEQPWTIKIEEER